MKLLLPLLFAGLLACGDDSSTTGSGGAGSGGDASTSTGGAGGEGVGGEGVGGEGVGGEGVGGEGVGGEGGSPPEIACGDVICGGGDVCIVTQLDADCTYPADEEACPEETSETYCGGAGIRCCCAAPPAPTRECAPPTGCDGEEPSCQCLDAPCDQSLECMNGATPGTFNCSSPALP